MQQLFKWKEAILLKMIDFHCHIYPDKIAEKAADATGAFYGTGAPLGAGTLADLQRRGREAGFTRQLIHSVATTPAQVNSINHFIAECRNSDPEHLIGFGALHPDCADAGADVQQILDLGLSGIKLHPDIQKFALNEPRSLRLLEANADRLPVLLHTGDARYAYSNPEQLIPVLEAFPHTIFIGAHMAGYSVWDRAEQQLYRRFDNLWADCSSTLFAVSPQRSLELIRSFGPERVMFGTDYPMWDPQQELERFEALDLTPREQELILYRNAEQLLGL